MKTRINWIWRSVTVALTIFTTACGGGSIQSSPTTPAPVAEFAFVANAITDNLSTFRLDSTTGLPTTNDVQVPAGFTPEKVRCCYELYTQSLRRSYKGGMS